MSGLDPRVEAHLNRISVGFADEALKATYNSHHSAMGVLLVAARFVAANGGQSANAELIMLLEQGLEAMKET